MYYYNMNLSNDLINSDDNNTNKEVKPNIIQCYDCNTDMNYKHYISCDGKCYWCWECGETQYIDNNMKTIKGHNIICDDYYKCNECNKTTIEIDNRIVIDYDDDFIFDKEPQTTIIKHNNMYYHYDCFCRNLGEKYMKLVCSKCKKYCKDINNMRNIYNKQYDLDDNRTYVCVECYNMTDIHKCYYNGHAGKYPILICCERNGKYNYANGCEVCIKDDWITGYCDFCR